MKKLLMVLILSSLLLVGCKTKAGASVNLKLLTHEESDLVNLLVNQFEDAHNVTVDVFISDDLSEYKKYDMVLGFSFQELEAIKSDLQALNNSMETLASDSYDADKKFAAYRYDQLALIYKTEYEGDNLTVADLINDDLAGEVAFANVALNKDLIPVFASLDNETFLESFVTDVKDDVLLSNDGVLESIKNKEKTLALTVLDRLTSDEDFKVIYPEAGYSFAKAFAIVNPEASDAQTFFDFIVSDEMQSRLNSEFGLFVSNNKVANYADYKRDVYLDPINVEEVLARWANLYEGSVEED